MELALVMVVETKLINIFCLYKVYNFFEFQKSSNSLVFLDLPEQKVNAYETNKRIYFYSCFMSLCTFLPNCSTGNVLQLPA